LEELNKGKQHHPPKGKYQRRLKPMAKIAIINEQADKDSTQTRQDQDDGDGAAPGHVPG